MKNPLLITPNELKVMEESIDSWRENMEDRQKSMQMHADVVEKIRTNVSDPDASDNIKLENGSEAMVPMNMLRDHPEMVEMIAKEVNSAIKPPMYFKDIAYNAIKKLHNINKFLEDFDELQLSKVKDEIADLTEAK